jgi:hypothetical protein
MRTPKAEVRRRPLPRTRVNKGLDDCRVREVAPLGEELRHQDGGDTPVCALTQEGMLDPMAKEQQAQWG